MQLALHTKDTEPPFLLRSLARPPAPNPRPTLVTVPSSPALVHTYEGLQGAPLYTSGPPPPPYHGATAASCFAAPLCSPPAHQRMAVSVPVDPPTDSHLSYRGT
ncbi:unnamed protein product [Gadus morhua 'NCC']